jgi:hypothetical protein
MARFFIPPIPNNMPKIYIDEFVGITNRLETLPLAFAIRRRYGHDIVLDWHELDSFSVDDTRRGKVRLLARLGAQRVRKCDAAMFATLAGKKIILRSLDGPDAELNKIYLEVARKIHIAPQLADSIREMFAAIGDRPVVGVHIRQGDYVLANENSYQINEEWPAVPVWWYEAAMAGIVAKQPDVCFLLSCNGDPASFRNLHDRFDIVTLNVPSHYHYKGSDHASTVNPVADLFALACCPTLLATPVSGYSHWAANALGSPTSCIVPVPGAARDNPLMGRVELYGSRLPRWRAAGRTGSDTAPLGEKLKGMDLDRRSDTAWL